MLRVTPITAKAIGIIEKIINIMSEIISIGGLINDCVKLSKYEYASTGATMMALIIGITGIVVGWVARILYVKYVSDKIEVRRS